MSLEQIAHNTGTDQNTTNSYLPLDEQLLNSKKGFTKTIRSRYS